MKDIFKNKKVIIAIIVGVLGVIVFLAVSLGGKDSKEDNKSNVNIETNQDDADIDEPIQPNENGLSVDSNEVDTIDGSGDWDSTESDSKDKNESKKDDKKQNAEQKQDKTDEQEDEDESKEDETQKDSGNMSGDNILVDDKEWGKID